MNQETKIQRKIQAFLNERKIFNYRVNADKNTIGIPDIIACYRGYFLGIEVKTPKGKLSEIQKEVRARIQDNFGYFIVPTSVDEVDDVLKEIDRCYDLINKKL
jgi:hypothetical protein